jgi:hypothetical protein
VLETHIASRPPLQNEQDTPEALGVLLEVLAKQPPAAKQLFKGLLSQTVDSTLWQSKNTSREPLMWISRPRNCD